MKSAKPKTAQLMHAARISQKATQAEFAKLLGVSRADVSKYETGRTTPAGDKILRLSEIISEKSFLRILYSL